MSQLLKLYILDMCTYLNKAAFFFFWWGGGGAGFSSGPDGKESACNARNPSSLPGSGRSPGE